MLSVRWHTTATAYNSLPSRVQKSASRLQLPSRLQFVTVTSTEVRVTSTVHCRHVYKTAVTSTIRYRHVYKSSRHVYIVSRFEDVTGSITRHVYKTADNVDVTRTFVDVTAMNCRLWPLCATVCLNSVWITFSPIYTARSARVQSGPQFLIVRAPHYVGLLF